jgi:large subunit ribosomal protein L9
MKIILNQSIEGVGNVGEIVQVKDGYARNFLIPRRLAVPATESGVRVVERQKAKEIQAEKEARARAQALAERLQSLALTIEANAGEDDKLFGSVSAADVHEALRQAGVEVDKKDVLLGQPLRKTGSFDVPVRCFTNLKSVVKVSIVRKKS